MKTKFVKTIIILLMVSSISYSQNPNFTRDKEGIPVLSSVYWGFQSLVHKQADSMGVDVYLNRVENIVSNMNDVIIANNFNIMPISIRNNSNVRFNWIEYYCDAKYTVWEAEGTNVVNVGRATLERDLKRTEAGEGVVRIKPEYANTIIDSMIYGPYYYQEKEYIAYREATDPKDTVKYKANFKLKLQYNSAYPNLDTLTENMDAEICKLLVTYSTIKCCEWRIDNTTTIDSLILKRRDFPILNNFIDAVISYSLGNVPHGGNNPPSNYYQRNIIAGIEGGFNGPENIEFKVVWLGNPNYLLSVDKITVSDERAFKLNDPNSDAKQNIRDQMNLLLLEPLYKDLVVGWWGIDEPYSIDNFEPIRIVDSLLNASSNGRRRLWVSFPSGWNGMWGNRPENFQNNHPLYHYPWANADRIHNMNTK